MFRPKSPQDFKIGFSFVFAGLAFFVPCALIGWYVHPRLAIAQRGPTEIAAAEIGKVNRPEELPSPWVTFNFEKSVPTKFARVETVSHHVEHVYILVQAGDRWLLSAVPEKFQGNRLTGELRTIPAFEFDDVYAATAETHKGQLLPFQFDAKTNFAENVKTLFWSMVGGCGVGLLLFGIGLYLAVASFYCEPKAAPTSMPAFRDYRLPVEARQ